MRENEVEVHLGGTKRLLRYTTRSMLMIERDTGRPATDVISSIETETYGTAVRLVRAGMLHLPKQPTEEQVADWFDLLSPKAMPEHDGEETLRSLIMKMAKAFAGGLPGVPRAPAEQKDVPADPTTPAP